LVSRSVQFSSAFSRRYKVLNQLGRGGAGMVFRAIQRELRRKVALKIVDPDLFEDDVARQRFSQESQVTAEIHHPNVLQVIEAGVDKGPKGELPYIVYELVEGEDLGTHLEKFGGRLAPEEALKTMVYVLRGLAAAHSRQPPILHRDIKPDNVLISSSGEVKVADFGIAKRKGHGPRTQTGMVVGTPTYMSPEQAQGLELAPTSDLYSTAVMAYECLVGRPPFQADSGMEVAVMHVRDEPPVPSSLNHTLPPQLDRILLRALDKNPRNRFQSAGEFADALEGASKAWSLWKRRMQPGGETESFAVPLERGISSSQKKVEDKGALATRSLDSSALQKSLAAKASPSLDFRTIFERSYLALVGVLLAAGVTSFLWLGGFLSSGSQEDIEGRFEPTHVRGEAGCLEASIRWESRNRYPSHIRYRRAGTSKPFLVVNASTPEPVDSHRVDLDTLLPGTEYEYHIVFPDGGRSLRYTFKTQQIRFLHYPAGKITEGGVLEVHWKLNIPARGVVRARQANATGGQTRTVDTLRYQQETVASIPGWKLEEDVEFMVLFYTEWWDEKLARDSDNRSDPELYLPWISIESLTSKKRGARDRLAGVLRTLPGTISVASLPVKTEADRLRSRERVLARAVDEGYYEARRGFEADLRSYFRSEGVDWAERLAWYEDVAGFQDWVQGLDVRGVPNTFVVQKLYPDSLRPLGRKSGIPDAFAKRLSFLYEDQEDPDFTPRVHHGPPLSTLPLESSPRWSHAELAVHVEGLDPGEILLLDLGGGYEVRFRALSGKPQKPGGEWYFHEIPLVQLPTPLDVTVGMYTASGLPPGDGVLVSKIELRGRSGGS
jgi:serine/threonine protein kinase